ncbi:c-type cytochrome [Pinibacter aurantiacus]|uniref:Cytochrome c n=1 Tax=Pinibacter aurantiacus TaxID=2851599 RepID=A0A9E2W369_9BACT|nr:cytochrome c [Pinibacter aurantiacus]MBV4355923.1 cytochrome c [Pinibacter aurantiacus]
MLLLFLAALYIASCKGRQEDEMIVYNKNSAALSKIDSATETKIITEMPATFGIGRKATNAEIKAWDIDVRPDGKGLPYGSGNATEGKVIFTQKCAACHGKEGEGGAYARLVGAMGDTVKAKTIGNYWPWSTTLFDYIRRTMPYNMPGSLKDDEVYSLTAYLLYRNKIIDSTKNMDAKSLPKVVMPARQYYVDDDRRGGPEIR